MSTMTFVPAPPETGEHEAVTAAAQLAQELIEMTVPDRQKRLNEVASKVGSTSPVAALGSLTIREAVTEATVPQDLPDEATTQVIEESDYWRRVLDTKYPGDRRIKNFATLVTNSLGMLALRNGSGQKPLIDLTTPQDRFRFYSGLLTRFEKTMDRTYITEGVKRIDALVTSFMDPELLEQIRASLEDGDSLTPTRIAQRVGMYPPKASELDLRRSHELDFLGEPVMRAKVLLLLSLAGKREAYLSAVEEDDAMPDSLDKDFIERIVVQGLLWNEVGLKGKCLTIRPKGMASINNFCGIDISGEDLSDEKFLMAYKRVLDYATTYKDKVDGRSIFSPQNIQNFVRNDYARMCRSTADKGKKQEYRKKLYNLFQIIIDFTGGGRK